MNIAKTMPTFAKTMVANKIFEAGSPVKDRKPHSCMTWTSGRRRPGLEAGRDDGILIPIERRQNAEVCQCAGCSSRKGKRSVSAVSIDSILRPRGIRFMFLNEKYRWTAMQKLILSRQRFNCVKKYYKCNGRKNICNDFYYTFSMVLLTRPGVERLFSGLNFRDLGEAQAICRKITEILIFSVDKTPGNQEEFGNSANFHLPACLFAGIKILCELKKALFSAVLIKYAVFPEK